MIHDVQKMYGMCRPIVVRTSDAEAMMDAPLNRKERRKEQKKIPSWMRDKDTVEILKTIGKNGITAKDLNEWYVKGLREGAQMEDERLIRLLYAAAGYAAHHMFGFGSKRVAKLLHMMDEELKMALDDNDMVSKLENAVGYRLRVKGEKYTIDWDEDTLKALEE